jgi:uncharacterized protein
MTLVRSRYLILGDQTYVKGADRVRMAYSARLAKLFPVDLDTAALLAGGDIGSIAAERLVELRAAKAVVDSGENELGEVLANYRLGSVDPTIRTLAIMPTSYCNMSCSYCGQEHFKAAVNRDKVERTVARVEAMFAQPATKEVVVAWFGGEPLLAYRVIQEMSARFVSAADAAGKLYSARMPTNGSLLTPRNLTQLHHACRLNAIDVTIDGPERVHDDRRSKRNGVGSFHRTIATLSQVVKDQSAPDLNIGIRMNVDRQNEDYVEDLLVDLACFGLASPQVELHLMPVHSWGNDVSQIEIEARRYAQREAGWLRRAQELGIRFPSVPNVVKKTTCPATSVYREIIDSAGQVFSCTEHPLVPIVKETGVVAQVELLPAAAPRPAGMFDDWYDQVDDGRQQCGRCPLLPVCGGSCPKQWREGNLPCPSLKFNWRERIDLAAHQLGYVPAGC